MKEWFTPRSDKPEKIASLQNLRERLLNPLLISAAVIGSGLYALSLIPAFQSGLTILTVVYTVIYIWLLAITFIRRIPYRVRVGSILLSLYALGVLNLATSGLNVDAGLFLLAFVAMTALLVGLRGGLVALASSGVTLASLGAFIVTGNISLGLRLPQENPLLWVIGGTILLLMGTLLTISLTALLRGLETSLTKAAALTTELEEEQVFLHQRNEELATINRVVAMIAAAPNLEEALQTITRELTLALPAGRAGIALMDDSRTMLNVVADYSRNPNEPTAIGLSIPLEGNPSSQQVIATRKPLIVSDAQNNPAFPPGLRAEFQKRGVEAVFILPILINEVVIGTLGIDIVQKGLTLTQEQINLVETILTQVSNLIEKARLYDAAQQEIAERKRTEKALSRSETELRALFASMTDVIIIYDKEGRYVRIAPTNPSRLFRPPEDLIGKTISEALPREVHEPFLRAIQTALQSGETTKLEYPLEIGSQIYWFDASVSKLGEDQVFWVARDISDRRKFEETLRRQNEYLATSAEIGRLVTSTLELETLFTRTVNLICERFGYYHAAIFIIEETGFNAVLEAATGEAGKEMRRRRHSLAVGSRSIVGAVTSSGNPLVVNDTSVDPIHRPNPLLPETRAEAAIPLRIGERIIGAIDIQSTQARAFVPADIAVLQTLADQIAIAIDNARSYQIAQQAIKEMSELDRLKSEFLANMSHELRTPLNSIIGFSRVILKGIDGPVSDLQEQDLNAIYNSGQHLLRLINDILDLSKIEAGKMELTFEDVNIADMVGSVIPTVTGLIKGKPIQLERNIAANIPVIHADSTRLRQVLINLLSNAAKFTDEGTITIQAGVETGPQNQPEIVIKVTDTGPGIALEDQKKLFQPFSQVDSSPTRKTGGSGLGLSICRRLVELHNGRIGVNSAAGKGSTFYFTLPIPKFKGTSQLSAGTTSGKVILAIDDDTQVITLYERYLHSQGYQLTGLADPAQAKERVRQLKPYAILLDILMPGRDGWAVLHDLKTDPETRDIPVIICSIKKEEEKGYNLGALAYLVKPILEDDLLHALHQLDREENIQNVLVIDDNPADLRLISKILNERSSYHVILAEGGRQGWEALTSHVPHAVILDLFMPGVDGFTILEKMQASPALRDIPVVVVSGGDLTAKQKERLSGFGQKLLKKSALTENELLAALDKALKRLSPQ